MATATAVAQSMQYDAQLQLAAYKLALHILIYTFYSSHRTWEKNGNSK